MTSGLTNHAPFFSLHTDALYEAFHMFKGLALRIDCQKCLVRRGLITDACCKMLNGEGVVTSANKRYVRKCRLHEYKYIGTVSSLHNVRAEANQLLLIIVDDG